MLVDMVGQDIAVDDYVCDDRGKVYRILPTQRSFERQLLAAAAQVKLGKRGPSMVDTPTYVRSYLVYKIEGPMSEDSARAAWQTAWKEEKSKQKKQEFSDRKSKVASTWEQVQNGVQE